ncbi:MAG TPA: hypothetical protein VFO10_05640 [Oligoflexus sp.]|nr:hypothetical protein [Oligoflexus sp.]HET9236709.1 hypothetical protein [Oligoflexus sp.]
MNLFLLGFVIQLVILYGMILFSDYLKSVSSKPRALRRPAKVRIRKR